MSMVRTFLQLHNRGHWFFPHDLYHRVSLSNDVCSSSLTRLHHNLRRRAVDIFLEPSPRHGCLRLVVSSTRYDQWLYSN